MGRGGIGRGRTGAVEALVFVPRHLFRLGSLPTEHFFKQEETWIPHCIIWPLSLDTPFTTFRCFEFTYTFASLRSRKSREWPGCSIRPMRAPSMCSS